MATQRKSTRKPKQAPTFTSPVSPGQIAVAITGAIGGDPAQVGKSLRRKLRSMAADADEKRVKASDHNKGDRWSVPAAVANELVSSAVSRKQS